MSESGEQDIKVIISTELIRFPLTERCRARYAQDAPAVYRRLTEES